MDTFIFTCEHGGNRVPAPYRELYRDRQQEVERLVTQSVSCDNGVIHMSSHSFAPDLDGRVRSADVGLRVRHDYPYAGRGDGLTSHLRLRFAQTDHAGIEREVNQALAFAAGRRWTALRGTLIDSLHAACAP